MKASTTKFVLALIGGGIFLALLAGNAGHAGIYQGVLVYAVGLFGYMYLLNICDDSPNKLRSAFWKVMAAVAVAVSSVFLTVNAEHTPGLMLKAVLITLAVYGVTVAIVLVVLIVIGVIVLIVELIRNEFTWWLHDMQRLTSSGARAKATLKAVAETFGLLAIMEAGIETIFPAIAVLVLISICWPLVLCYFFGAWCLNAHSFMKPGRVTV